MLGRKLLLILTAEFFMRESFLPTLKTGDYGGGGGRSGGATGKADLVYLVFTA